MKRMSAKEFRDLGLLQEVNRKFLHPMGLALEVIIDDSGGIRFGEVWDYRADPEGMAFADNTISKDKALLVNGMFEEKRKTREEKLGYHIQPV